MAGRKSSGTVAPQKTEANPLSASTLEKKISFKLNAPQAQAVQVAGCFNEWNPESFRLKKAADGNWKGEWKLTPGRYEYRFVVDGRWENDPKAASVPNNVGSTNSVLEVK
ncbi:MAG: isoamylase early set domain-containing protein [Candidatus Omnitrophica bacterium]|nr:isoamylase early set domain-containing protein [Candidatus Omnitrophota bacterium]